MCKLCLIYFYFFNIYICTKRYHRMHKYQQVNLFSNVVKSVRPTYGNKEELAASMHRFLPKTFCRLMSEHGYTKDLLKPSNKSHHLQLGRCQFQIVISAGGVIRTAQNNLCRGSHQNSQNMYNIPPPGAILSPHLPPQGAIINKQHQYQCIVPYRGS